MRCMRQQSPKYSGRMVDIWIIERVSRPHLNCQLNLTKTKRGTQMFPFKTSLNANYNYTEWRTCPILQRQALTSCGIARFINVYYMDKRRSSRKCRFRDESTHICSKWPGLRPFKTRWQQMGLCFLEEANFNCSSIETRSVLKFCEWMRKEEC